MDGEEKKKEKKFISEKIVGRELTARRAAKYLALAAAGGVVFGLCAAAVFSCCLRVGAMLETNRNGGSGGNEADVEIVPQTREQETEENGAGEAEGNPGAQSAPAIQTETQTETTEDISEIVRSEVEQYSFTAEDYQTMLAAVRETVTETDLHIVSIQAVRRNTGWFNDTIETAQLASGMIVSTEDPDIQILTTETAVNGADQLTVTFRDGTVRDAALRQISHTDGTALITVSKTGLGSEFLSSISQIPFGSLSTVHTGDMILAVGSPLGASHSLDIGYVGYIMSGEQTSDGSMDVLYSDVVSDVERGTFIINLKGELIGMAHVRDADSAVESRTSIIGITRLKKILSYLSEGKSMPYLGIEGRTVTAQMDAEGIPQGVYVTAVRQDSPAYLAGVKSGDIVVGLNETEIGSMVGYEEALSAVESGAQATLRVQRSSGSGEYRELSFTMAVAAR